MFVVMLVSVFSGRLPNLQWLRPCWRWSHSDAQEWRVSDTFPKNTTQWISSSASMTLMYLWCCCDVTCFMYIFVHLWRVLWCIFRQTIDVIHMLEGRAYSISVPVQITSINMLSRFDWLLTDPGNKCVCFAGLFTWNSCIFKSCSSTCFSWLLCRMYDFALIDNRLT